MVLGDWPAFDDNDSGKRDIGQAGAGFMIVDLRALEPGVSLTCDLCIVGGGAAGLSLASAFLGQTTRVLILEAGGPTAHGQDLDPHRGEVSGHPYPPLHEKRPRCLGGGTTAWGGACVRLRERDFAGPDGLAWGGWPIGTSALAPYHRRAEELLGLGDLDDLTQRNSAPPGPAFDPRILETCEYAYSDPPVDLGEVYRDALKQSLKVDLIHYATATEIQTTRNGATVESLIVKAPGREGITQVRAKLFVLALGGLETPRLLLNSTRICQAGVGNPHDLVGRFFADHLQLVGGRTSTWLSDWPRHYARKRWTPTARRQIAITLSDDLRGREGVLAASARFGRGIPRRKISIGYQALHRLKVAAQKRSPAHLVGSEPLDMLTDLPNLAAAIRELLDPRAYAIISAEQVPDPESRVTLGDGRDAFGLRRLKLDWRINEAEQRTVRRLIHLLDLELRRLGAGRLIPAAWLAGDTATWARHVFSGSHHLGTTRMAADPRQGVVDADGRVHGMDNLYVSGAGVFPTGGFANPTYTIVLLALRLAEHLHGRLAARVVGQRASRRADCDDDTPVEPVAMPRAPEPAAA